MNTEALDLALGNDSDVDAGLTGPFRHPVRIVLLMLAAAVFLGWSLRHSEATLRDGLRSIRAAQSLNAGEWREGLREVEHPLHPLAIAAAHRLIGGEGPEWWQRAAVSASFGAVVLMIIPLYLAGRDLFGDRAAWLGCVLFVFSPIVSSLVVNVLSESTFLLMWAWGLWASVRFLREGHTRWLPAAAGFGVLAYLTRPEGLLLPASLLATLLVIPLHHATRINWPRWRRATGLLGLGAIALAAPYVAATGSVTVRPGPARVLGLEAASAPMALEREAPMVEGQSTSETYRLAALRLIEVVRADVPILLLATAFLAAATAHRHGPPSRTWAFLVVVLAASALALVRLHATAGYCSPRNALAPAMILILTAAAGLDRLMTAVAIPGRFFGLPQERLRPGPVLWAAALAAIVILPRFREPSTPTPGPFNVYWDAGRWLAGSAKDGKILDLTDWSLYFSRRPGTTFAQVREAAADPTIRWVVATRSQIESASTYASTLRELIGDRPPIAVLAGGEGENRVQIQIFERADNRVGAVDGPTLR
ncbi:glycosyltransferase family 39 protein [Paludisphaera rhizosphaerae]|uniref:glycosyltransferase family 39 protein n=1 Tax=Paludisphaera rhizosphaerae TaxID=2711216 RepID=UPI0013EDF0C1|nr:glycosyltransferase family 39 protein [Paludisphaera rhizosphaerae]